MSLIADPSIHSKTLNSSLKNSQNYQSSTHTKNHPNPEKPSTPKKSFKSEKFLIFTSPLYFNNRSASFIF